MNFYRRQCERLSKFGELSQSLHYIVDEDSFNILGKMERAISVTIAGLKAVIQLYIAVN